jgi:hypothetical protein
MYLRIKINFNQNLYAFEYSFLIFTQLQELKKPLIFGSRLSGLIRRGGFFATLREKKRMFQPAAVDGEANPVSPE